VYSVILDTIPLTVEKGEVRQCTQSPLSPQEPNSVSRVVGPARRRLDPRVMYLPRLGSVNGVCTGALKWLVAGLHWLHLWTPVDSSSFHS